MLLLAGIEPQNSYSLGEIMMKKVAINLSKVSLKFIKKYYLIVDVWSVGCIFAELLRRKPFLPGIDSKLIKSR